MKISASIYSNGRENLTSTIEALNENEVDLFHVDCNDDLSVFEDIKAIKKASSIPIDLHIITDDATKFYPYLLETPVEYVTFQYEDLTDKKLEFPEINCKWGLSVTSNTSIDIFEEYENQFDFILFMATIPGQSGGVFDKINFQKIRNFRKRFPSKKIHVDGGVNGEISFILRNMAVDSSVSGSYIFKSGNIGKALLNLKTKEIESTYHVQDFMRTLEEFSPLHEGECSLKNVLESIEKINLGVTAVVDSEGKLKGIIGNADVRRGLLKNIDQLDKIELKEILNDSPVTVREDATVVELLKLVKSYSFPISYLPVVDQENRLKGLLSFVNLIKGEL